MYLLDYAHNVDGYTVTFSGRVYGRHGRELKPTILSSGYKSVGMQLAGSRRHSRLVHRVVAEAFVRNPRPDLYNQVNHLDHNRLRTDAGNLEWCDNALNNRDKYAYRVRNGLPYHTEAELAAYARRRK